MQGSHSLAIHGGPLHHSGSPTSRRGSCLSRWPKRNRYPMTVLASGVNAFHVLGGVLALWAVVLAAMGVRHAGFPGSLRGERAVGAISTLLVIAAISAGIITSAMEEPEREAGAGRPAGERGEEGVPPPAQTGAEAETAPPAREVAGDPEAGSEVFSAAGCGSCHTLGAAGARGSIGPNLDETLAGRDEAYVRQAIAEPNAVIAEGFSPGVMPQDFADQLSEQELNDLVAFVLRATRR